MSKTILESSTLVEDEAILRNRIDGYFIKHSYTVRVLGKLAAPLLISIVYRQTLRKKSLPCHCLSLLGSSEDNMFTCKATPTVPVMSTSFKSKKDYDASSSI